MNPYLLGFRCTRCEQMLDVEEALYTCLRCGGNLDAHYDYAGIARHVNPAHLIANPNHSVWRYAPLLPIGYPVPAQDEQRQAELRWHPLTTFGDSPLIRAPKLERLLDVRTVWLKDDSRLPSSSFKDRASSMVIARALHAGIQTICAASTGNAASSLATLCAGVGIQAVIFVPRSTPEGKLAQMLVHGAQVYAVEGSYDEAFDLALQATREFGWYNRNTGFNPYTREGKKTAAFEICEQLARFAPDTRAATFRAPDVVIVPVGDGNIISGLHKGFKDLVNTGWIERMPRLIGVTAALAPALYRAWQSGSEQITPVPATTIAGGISADLPRDGVMALRAVRESGGLLIEASDEEMLDGIRVLASTAAVFVEPACAAAYVGLVKASRSGIIRPDEEVVLQLTGSGLKDVKSALYARAGRLIPIQPRIEDVRRFAEG
ncbi:MAG: threonine synthase [Anaerolineae bacterium]|nr:threonine synthase [Thermoflexales bacterium]MDW8406376.1 threonine synthase [Anaerolineae bacterium]